MSLQSQLTALVSYVGADIKSIRAIIDDDTALIVSTSGIFVVSGWTVDAFEAARIDRHFKFRLGATRTGGTINVGATGDISNTLMGTFDVSVRPRMIAACSGPAATGRMTAGYVSPANGQLLLSAVASGSGNITNGDSVEIAGDFFLPKRT